MEGDSLRRDVPPPGGQPTPRLRGTRKWLHSSVQQHVPGGKTAIKEAATHAREPFLSLIHGLLQLQSTFPEQHVIHANQGASSGSHLASLSAFMRIKTEGRHK